MNSARQSLGQQQQESPSRKNENAANTTTSTSFGSFLNNMQQRHRDLLSDNNNNVKNAENPKDGNQRPVLVLVHVVSRKSMTCAISWAQARAARSDAPSTDEPAKNAQ
jgi:hypothetical protein